MRRKSTQRFIGGMTCALLIFGSLLYASVAFARGAMITPNALSAPDQAKLIASIAKAKKADPSAFQMVAKVHTDAAEFDAKKRGRLATLTPGLKAMRGRALFPILEQLAIDGLPRQDRNDSTWLAWRLALLEALGSIRDERSAPVLVAILDSSESSFPLVRASAQALGKLGSSQAASKLIVMSRARDAKRMGVIAGMGHCRRAMVASRLAEILSSAKRDADVELYARSMGDVANSWAWQTPVIAKSGERKQTRDIALDALLDSFIAQGSAHARKMLTQAVLVVDHPATKKLIEQKKAGRSATTQRALEGLAKRYDNSPLH